MRVGPGGIACALPCDEDADDECEEAVVNALVANEDMTGRDGHRTPALPRHRTPALPRDRTPALPRDRVAALLAAAGRLT